MIRAKIPAVVLDDRTLPVGQAVAPALINDTYWRRVEHAVRAAAAAGTHEPLLTAIKFLDDCGTRIAAPGRDSLARDDALDVPAKAALREIDRPIGDRAGSFTTAPA